MGARSYHRSIAHGKVIKYDVSEDPQGKLEPDPRKRFAKPGEQWIYEPGKTLRANGQWLLKPGSGEGQGPEGAALALFKQPDLVKASAPESINQQLSYTGQPSRHSSPGGGQGSSTMQQRTSGSRKDSPRSHRESSVEQRDDELVCTHW